MDRFVGVDLWATILNTVSSWLAWYIEINRPLVSNAFGFSPRLRTFYYYFRFPLILLACFSTSLAFAVFANPLENDFYVSLMLVSFVLVVVLVLG